MDELCSFSYFVTIYTFHQFHWNISHIFAEACINTHTHTHTHTHSENPSVWNKTAAESRAEPEGGGGVDNCSWGEQDGNCSRAALTRQPGCVVKWEGGSRPPGGGGGGHLSITLWVILQVLHDLTQSLLVLDDSGRERNTQWLFNHLLLWQFIFQWNQTTQVMEDMLLSYRDAGGGLMSSWAAPPPTAGWKWASKRPAGSPTQ